MDIGTINAISKEAINTLLMISYPVLLISLVSGVLISLIQALTQMQEITLTFIPKIIIMYISLKIFGNHMFLQLNIFTQYLMQYFIY